MFDDLITLPSDVLLTPDMTLTHDQWEEFQDLRLEEYKAWVEHLKEREKELTETLEGEPPF